MNGTLINKLNYYVIQPIRFRLSKSALVLYLQWLGRQFAALATYHLGRRHENIVQAKGVRVARPARFLCGFLRFKNEARYLPEWLCHHHALGIEHFFLYNNNSTDDFREVLEPFQKAGLVTLRDWPRVPCSPTADIHCVQDCIGNVKWLACFDTDEFFIPLAGKSLAEELAALNPACALAVNWRFFGSNQHVQRPRQLVTEAYTRRNAATNRHVKVIVRPERCIRNVNSHGWLYTGLGAATDERGKKVYGAFNDGAQPQRLVMHHYYCKSQEDYLLKCDPSWSVDVAGQKFRTHRQELIAKAMAENNDIVDESALKFAPQTKALLLKFGFSEDGLRA